MFSSSGVRLHSSLLSSHVITVRAQGTAPRTRQGTQSIVLTLGKDLDSRGTSSSNWLAWTRTDQQERSLSEMYLISPLENPQIEVGVPHQSAAGLVIPMLTQASVLLSNKTGRDKNQPATSTRGSIFSDSKRTKRSLAPSLGRSSSHSLSAP